MKLIDLNNKSREELNQLLTDLRAKLLKLNFDLVDSKVKDVSQIGKTKKNIARIITAMTAMKNLNKQHGAIQ